MSKIMASWRSATMRPRCQNLGGKSDFWPSECRFQLSGSKKVVRSRLKDLFCLLGMSVRWLCRKLWPVEGLPLRGRGVRILWGNRIFDGVDVVFSFRFERRVLDPATRILFVFLKCLYDDYVERYDQLKVGHYEAEVSELWWQIGFLTEYMSFSIAGFERRVFGFRHEDSHSLAEMSVRWLYRKLWPVEGPPLWRHFDEFITKLSKMNEIHTEFITMRDGDAISAHNDVHDPLLAICWHFTFFDDHHGQLHEIDGIITRPSTVNDLQTEFINYRDGDAYFAHNIVDNPLDTIAGHFFHFRWSPWKIARNR